MLKSSTVTIACVLCVGAARERYLEAALASIADAVDVLAVNDNSGLVRSENRVVLEDSALAARGALRVAAHPFVDFADMRNRAFAQLRELAKPPDWVLFLDADEVHGQQLRYVARKILPRVDLAVGEVDAYTYHFWGTHRWITDVARRLVFFRYDPAIVWTGRVHEKALGIGGRALVLPYTYHHYGNVVPPATLARKHQQYFALGNKVPRPPQPKEATADVYVAKAREVRPYRGAHPTAVRATLERLRAEYGLEFAALDAALTAARGPHSRARGGLHAFNEALRVELRRVQRPFVYPLPSRAR
ncbi:MAG: hypothetical protein M3R44_03435 [Candidatus Eremiobacteraeota bacterium]|nr:hypothetical protein [Candidatus Eremiobacteraeota bacterium]